VNTQRYVLTLSSVPLKHWDLSLFHDWLDYLSINLVGGQDSIRELDLRDFRTSELSLLKTIIQVHFRGLERLCITFPRHRYLNICPEYCAETGRDIEGYFDKVKELFLMKKGPRVIVRPWSKEVYTDWRI